MSEAKPIRGQDPELYQRLRKMHSYFLKNLVPTSNWLGNASMQWPTDLIAYQEVLWASKPGLIIESGTLGGACTLFFATILDLMKLKDSKVVTIDVADMIKDERILNNPNIIRIIGDSVDPNTVKKVKEHWNPDISTLVTLDSRHDMSHVLKEMELYGPLVSIGSYLIAQDSLLGYYIEGTWQAGPLGAIQKFLETHDGFEIDKFATRWLLTQHPFGFLKRVK